MQVKYPVYIISKGRWENPMTAKFLKADGVPFKILVEPQEYDNYCDALGSEFVMKLPFKNLGLGSYPARNIAWEDAIKNGYNYHWLFDDNIARMRMTNNGNKTPIDTSLALNIAEDFVERYENIGIAGFNYESLLIPSGNDKKPFVLNGHVYSGMIIRNDLPFRWRMKYNEDVDLCLQVLDTGYWCTVLFNALLIEKTSTVAKMKGGNQTELYKGNTDKLKILKARSLESVWPRYASTIIRFHRPHHFVNWNSFKHGLIRRTDIDWNAIKNKKYNLKKNKIK